MKEYAVQRMKVIQLPSIEPVFSQGTIVYHNIIGVTGKGWTTEQLMRWLRDGVGIQVPDIASMIGVSRRTVEAWMSGRIMNEVYIWRLRWVLVSTPEMQSKRSAWIAANKGKESPEYRGMLSRIGEFPRSVIDGAHLAGLPDKTPELPIMETIKVSDSVSHGSNKITIEQRKAAVKHLHERKKANKRRAS